MSGPGGTGPVGLLTEGAELAVALAPETMLVCSFKREFDFHLIVEDANRLAGPRAIAMPGLFPTFVAADRMVYGRSRADLLAAVSYVPPHMRGYEPPRRAVRNVPERLRPKEVSRRRTRAPPTLELNRNDFGGDSIALQEDGVHERANPFPPVTAAIPA